MSDLPSGSIVLWNGLIINIPSGYVLCDGLNGTPDLRDRFVQGAGGLLAPDDTGGSEDHSHSFVSDGHSHDLPAGVGIGAGASWDTQTSDEAVSGDTPLDAFLPPYYALAYIMRT